jgi:hypothetical protein
MSLDFCGISFFLARGAEITQLHAYDRMQKIHTDATRPVGARGACTPPKRPQFDQKSQPLPGRWLHFGGLIEVVFIRVGVCTWMKTRGLSAVRLIGKTAEPEKA